MSRDNIKLGDALVVLGRREAFLASRIEWPDRPADKVNHDRYELMAIRRAIECVEHAWETERHEQNAA